MRYVIIFRYKFGGFVVARLTRTQKFAELRDSLANDKETSLKTKDLSSYEDRLNNIKAIERIDDLYDRGTLKRYLL